MTWNWDLRVDENTRKQALNLDARDRAIAANRLAFEEGRAKINAQALAEELAERARMWGMEP